MVRVLVASDIRLYREGLAEMLENDGRLAVAATASSVDEVLRGVRAADIQVALVDMGIPEGLAGVKSIAQCRPGIKIVALGISETRSDVLSCAEAGVQGYVCRESSLEDLVEAVLSAVEGKLHCPPAIAAALMDGVAKLAARATTRQRVRLTRRELEVAELIDAGLANREIANRLHIAVPTVKVHVHNILDKLGVHQRGAAAAKLRRSGLLRLPHRGVGRPTPLV
jgi:two-component system nitrate/nitrite response regulator NarL